MKGGGPKEIPNKAQDMSLSEMFNDQIQNIKKNFRNNESDDDRSV